MASPTSRTRKFLAAYCVGLSACRHPANGRHTAAATAAVKAAARVAPGRTAPRNGRKARKGGDDKGTARTGETLPSAPRLHSRRRVRRAPDLPWKWTVSDRRNAVGRAKRYKSCGGTHERVVARL